VISLVLHGGAALVIIYFSGFNTIGKHSANFVIQDVELKPSIAAPAPPFSAPPDEHQAAATPAPPILEAEKPVQEAPPALQPAVAANGGKEGGITSTPLGLGMTHGYFSMLADGKTLREDIRAYYFEMVEKINREWWDKAPLLKDPLREDGLFEILIQRDGAIDGLWLLRGTGSKEADRLIAEIVRKASPLPPLPTTYPLDQFRAPLKIKSPLFLFRSKD
jgi:protein TonB